MDKKVSSYSWYGLGLLTLVYVFNYLDRTIIYILLPLIKKEMAFTDLQLPTFMTLPVQSCAASASVFTSSP